MLDNLDEFIKNFYGSEKTNLKDSGIEVFRSTQVTLRTIDENLEYKEITIGQLPMIGNAKRKQGANPKTIVRQTLQFGDVLISARSKLEKVGLVRDRDLRRNMPTVAMNGMIIIRSDSEELGYFIKSYLESSEVQEFVNNDPRTMQNGKRVITTDIILELPFPSIIEKDFSMFKKYKEYFDLIHSKSFRTQTRLSRLRNMQLAKAYLLDINVEDSYNQSEWQKIDDTLNEMEKHIESLAEKIGPMGKLFL